MATHYNLPPGPSIDTRYTLGSIMDALTDLEQSFQSFDSEMDEKYGSLEDKLTILDTKVSDLDTKVSNLNVTVSNLDAKVTTLETNVSSLNAKVITLDANITTLEVMASDIGVEISQLKTNVTYLDDTMRQNNEEFMILMDGLPNNETVKEGKMTLRVTEPALEHLRKTYIVDVSGEFGGGSPGGLDFARDSIDTLQTDTALSPSVHNEPAPTDKPPRSFFAGIKGDIFVILGRRSRKPSTSTPNQRSPK
ncbi:hypothetical protein QCA50_013850 [Cerrena zonata]|uniref:Uncharacterized protein n=1 Tax=Cerrena zonata TaxID=2478898 RepID=A0AAW0FV33_9APHY